MIGRLAPVGAFGLGTLSDVDAEARSADGHSTASGVSRGARHEEARAALARAASRAGAGAGHVRRELRSRDRRELVRRRHTRLPRSSVPGRDARSGQARHARSRVAAFGSSQPRARRPRLALLPSRSGPGRRLQGVVLYGRSNDHMKRITTLLGALLLVLCFGAGQAVAADGGGAAQTAGQSATSGQSAGGASGAYQAGPSNSASLDSRAQPRQRRGRVAVEHDDRGRPCGKRQHDEPEHEPVAGWRLRLRPDPDRRTGGPEHAGRERGRTRGAARAQERRPVDPRAQPRQRRRCDPVELGDRRRGRPERQRDGSDDRPDAESREKG